MGLQGTWDEGFHKFRPDQTPIELPLHYKKPEPLHELIKRLVKNETNQAWVAAQGLETFEEADDFDVPEDNEMTSQYEMTEMQEEYVQRPADNPAGDTPLQAESAETDEDANRQKADKRTAGKVSRKAKKAVDNSVVDNTEVEG